MGMAEFQATQGMLIANTVLTKGDAIKVLEMLLSATKNGQTYVENFKTEVEKFRNTYLHSEWKTHQRGDGSSYNQQH